MNTIKNSRGKLTVPSLFTFQGCKYCFKIPILFGFNPTFLLRGGGSQMNLKKAGGMMKFNHIYPCTIVNMDFIISLSSEEIGRVNDLTTGTDLELFVWNGDS